MPDELVRETQAFGVGVCSLPPRWRFSGAALGQARATRRSAPEARKSLRGDLLHEIRVRKISPLLPMRVPEIDQPGYRDSRRARATIDPFRCSFISRDPKETPADGRPTVPTKSIASAICRALPSRIGSSGPSTSTTALSIPFRADRKCSPAEILLPRRRHGRVRHRPRSPRRPDLAPVSVRRNTRYPAPPKYSGGAASPCAARSRKSYPC